MPSAPRSHALYLPPSPQDPREALLASRLLQQEQPHLPGNGSLMQSRLLELRGPRLTSLSSESKPNALHLLNNYKAVISFCSPRTLDTEEAPCPPAPPRGPPSQKPGPLTEEEADESQEPWRPSRGGGLLGRAPFQSA